MESRRPNIILILIDDLGWKDLSCYGSSFYETPNIDALCGGGMTFTNAYAACPVCSPTRASLMTGRYPARIGVTNFIDHSNHQHPDCGALVDVPYFKELPRTEVTLPRLLKEAGYSTWHVGKWHLGGRSSYPERHGFEVNIGGCENGSPLPGGYFSPWKIPVLADADVPDGSYLTDYLTDEAVRLIKSSLGSSNPFFLNLWYYSVHTPIEAKGETIEKYKQKAQRLGLDTIDPFEYGDCYPAEHKREERICRRRIQSDPEYAAMLENLDTAIGRLLALLRETGIEEETLLLFTSDNGGLATAGGSPTSNAPLAEGKGWKYEGGIRVPLAIRWPGVVQEGSRSDEPVTSPDIFTTLLDAAGVTPPENLPVDGESLLSLLDGDGWTRSAPIYWHFPHYCNQGDTPGMAVRDGKYKLIYFFESDHLELYNLEEDPGEGRDISDLLPEITSALLERLSTWEQDVCALRPSLNPDFRPWKDRSSPGRASICF